MMTRNGSACRTRNLNTHLIKLQPRPMPATPRNVADARKLARAFWRAHGSSYSYLLTRPDDNAKLAKAGKRGGKPTYGLSLAPANVSGEWNTCPWSTALCRRGCLNTAGKGELDRVQRGRRIKTLFLAEHPEAFLTILVAELNAAVRKHPRGILMRLNVLSDLDWLAIWPDVFTIRGVTFYDYTKDASRAWRYIDGELPTNYRIVFSASERSRDDEITDMLSMGGTVATVFDKVVPDTYLGVTVIDGDSSDDRWHDRGGVIVGLKAKGRMRKPEYKSGGFVR